MKRDLETMTKRAGDDGAVSSRVYARYKRAFDLALLVIAHLVLFPAWLALWISIPVAIWLDDRRPIFYAQDRVGKDGRIFSLLKFRSMRDHFEGVNWSEDTVDDDARVTRVGKLIRRTALDEIPQMINLWKGDISFVGPRALPIRMHMEYVMEEPRFVEREVVKPGLTGLAQLNLPRHCSALKRLRYDLLYAKNTSIWLDVKLIVASVWITVMGRWGTGVRKRE